MIREIGQQYSLIMFPEGGRSDGREIGEFKSGLYYLCKKRPDLELIPVHIDNMNRILPRGEVLPVPHADLHHIWSAHVAGSGRTQNRVPRPHPRSG